MHFFLNFALMASTSKDILPGHIAYSWVTHQEKERHVFLKEHVLVMQIAGRLTVETSAHRVSTKEGEVLLLRKNQLVRLTKTPAPGKNYEVIIVLLQEEILQRYALEQQVNVQKKYSGKPGVFIPGDAFLQSYFQSLLPYIGKARADKKNKLGILKVKEAIGLLLEAWPEAATFLFDFSEPHKIDLEKFMLSNFQFNVPVEKFAALTGRSLAGFKRDFQKLFQTSPRQWLQDKRLTEARYQIEKMGKKPSAVYLDLGFENLSHFSFSFKQKYGVAPSEI